MRKAAFGWLLVVLQCCSMAAFAGDKKFCDLSFVVLKENSGKPVKYASVILHGVDAKGHQLHEGLQVKTDREGHAQASGIPYGKVRVQVIATGLQTYGEDFDLDEPAKEITIKLKQPQGQYSIYDDHPKEEQKPKDDQKQKPPVAKQ
jgi:hypothetical protein